MSNTITKSYLISYLSIPSLSKYFWLLSTKYNERIYEKILKLHITDSTTDILISNTITHKYVQTDKCEGDTLISSILYLNGKFNNEDIIIKEKVDYKSYERTGNIFLKYLLASKISDNYTNKMFINKEYKIYGDEDTEIVDNFWYILPNTSANTLDEINQLIYKNKEHIEILE